MERDQTTRKAIGLLMSTLENPVLIESTGAKTFAELFSEARERSGLSLQKLADAIGYSKSYTWEVEQGRCNPSADFVYKSGQILPIETMTLLEAVSRSYD